MKSLEAWFGIGFRTRFKGFRYFWVQWLRTARACVQITEKCFVNLARNSQVYPTNSGTPSIWKCATLTTQSTRIRTNNKIRQVPQIIKSDHTSNHKVTRYLKGNQKLFMKSKKLYSVEWKQKSRTEYVLCHQLSYKSVVSLLYQRRGVREERFYCFYLFKP